MHTTANVKQCQFYAKGHFCPFNELGCKFRHEDEENVRDMNVEEERRKKDITTDTEVHEGVKSRGKEEESKQFGNVFESKKRIIDIFDETESKKLKIDRICSFLTSTPKKRCTSESLPYLGH